MENGFHPGVSFPDYLAIDAVSASFINAYRRHPRRARYGNREQSTAMQLGTMAHAAILEPDVFRRRYLPTDLPRRGTKLWAEAEAEAEAAGAELVKLQDYNEAVAIAHAVHSHPTLGPLLADCPDRELTAYHDGKRCRFDACNRETGLILDIKRTADARRFSSKAANLGYVRQAAWYSWIMAELADVQPRFLFGVVDVIDGIPDVMVYEPAPDDIQIALEECKDTWYDIQECYRTGTWPGYPVGITPLDMPAWYYASIDDSEGWE
ncbi:MAG TPA: PD-(D/E)XK nuclease-like domain-containing protein, partial [Acidimicrobiia bacterium]